MTFYKVIDETGFVGVGTTKDLRKHQKKHNVLLEATENEAQYIAIGDDLYRDKWCRPITTEFILATVEDEYNGLREAIANNEEIPAIEEQPVEEPVEEPVEVAASEAEELTAEYVRAVKIKELSLACNKAITDGFDATLSDGTHHFSLTLQDQANLNSASVSLLNGDSEIVYHADGEEYRVYSVPEMLAVIQDANQHRLKHLAYFGCLKAWINALVRVKTIQDIEYGAEIPKRYQSSVYKSIAG